MIQARATTQHKETRIIMKAGWIKKHCAFLDETEYSKGSDYGRFMKAFTSYKREGDNAHDDAPDGMTILAEFAEAIGLNLKSKPVRWAVDSIHSYNYIKNVVITSQMNQRIWLSLLCS